MQTFAACGQWQFLSTPSARRATGAIQGLHQNHRISIHALREEGDVDHVKHRSGSTLFLSTPSARRATTNIFEVFGGKDISIHALREEGDFDLHIAMNEFDKISIHALREEGDLSSCSNQ